MDIKLIDLYERLEKNAKEAQSLYKEIQELNKEYISNLFNNQAVINWQDILNDVSITKKEDAE